MKEIETQQLIEVMKHNYAGINMAEARRTLREEATAPKDTVDVTGGVEDADKAIEQPGVLFELNHIR